jgi:hypothetical protein
VLPAQVFEDFSNYFNFGERFLLIFFVGIILGQFFRLTLLASLLLLLLLLSSLLSTLYPLLVL